LIRLVSATVLLLCVLRDSIAWEQPREEIHRCDSHADAEENARKHAL
jgi:hypothetical protein